MRTELDENHVIFVSAEEVVEKTAPEECPGEFAEQSHVKIIPKAKPGYLCVYEGRASGNLVHTGETGDHWKTEVEVRTPEDYFKGASAVGALLVFRTEEANVDSAGYGMWAVTAE